MAERSPTRPNLLYKRTRKEVQLRIGLKWLALARELGFSQTDVDGIRCKDKDNLEEQIEGMLQKWEETDPTHTIYQLLSALHDTTTSTGDETYKNIADYIFETCMKAVIDEKVSNHWKKMATEFNFSHKDIEPFMSKDANLSNQAYVLVQLLCKKEGWQVVVSQLPEVLATIGYTAKAEKLSEDFFGMSLNDLKAHLKPSTQYEPSDMVMVVHGDSHLYGVVKWTGTLPGHVEKMAGLEMEDEYPVLEDKLCQGSYKGKSYFISPRGAFFPFSELQRDPRVYDDSSTIATPPGFSRNQSATLDSVEQDSPQRHTTATKDGGSPTLETLPSSMKPSIPPQPIALNNHDEPQLDMATPPPFQTSGGGQTETIVKKVAEILSPTREEKFKPVFVRGSKSIYIFHIPGDLAGLLIGKEGATVKHIQNESKAKVLVTSKKQALANDTEVAVFGEDSNCAEAIKMILNLIEEKQRKFEAITETVTLTDLEAGKVIGKEAKTLRIIKQASGAKIEVDRRPKGEVAFPDTKRKCKITGLPEQVGTAKELIEQVRRGLQISPEKQQVKYLLNRLVQEFGVTVPDKADISDQLKSFNI